MEVLKKLLEKKDSDLSFLNKKEFISYFKSKDNVENIKKQLLDKAKVDLDELLKNKKDWKLFISNHFDSESKKSKTIHEVGFKSYNRGIQYETTLPGQRFQADLADMNFLKKHKIPLRQYSWVLVVVDLYSTRVWYIAVTRKNSTVMGRVMKKFFEELREAYGINDHIWLHVDKGGEFYNKKVEQIMKDLNITLYSTKGKAFLAEERIYLLKKFFRDLIPNGGLKEILKKGVGQKNWWTLLEKIQSKVNRLKNSRLGKTPNEIWNNGEGDNKILFEKNKKVTTALKSEYQRNLKEKTKIEKHSVGGLNMHVDENDEVKIQNVERNDENNKSTFTKRSTNVDGNWSKSKYIISKVLRNNGNIGPSVLYQLKDEDGKQLEGLFTREDFYNTSQADRLHKKIEKEQQMEEYG